MLRSPSPVAPIAGVLVISIYEWEKDARAGISAENVPSVISFSTLIFFLMFS